MNKVTTEEITQKAKELAIEWITEGDGIPRDCWPEFPPYKFEALQEVMEKNFQYVLID